MAAEFNSKKAFAPVLSIWIAVDVTTLICNRLCVYFVFTGKMSEWQVVTHLQSQAAAASSTTFPSLAFFRIFLGSNESIQ
jgi:hypothetical protein